MEKLWFIIAVTFLYFNIVQTRNASTKAGNYAVIKGQMVRMDCIPPGVLIDPSTISGRRSFVWTDEEGKEIVNPRMVILETGKLQIIRAYEGDSGIYHCKFRPSEALDHVGQASRIFVHKLIVYQLSGHKFMTIVTFDVTKAGSEPTITLLRDLMKYKVCGLSLCIPGPVASEKCELTDTEKQMCEMSMTYEGLEAQQNARCNETCAKQITIERLKRAQKLLETILLAISEDSKSRLRPELHTFDTKHLITCKAGYHLIDANYEHCFPCLPGSYSEPEVLKCELCPISFYQEKYGSHDCEQCRDDLTTETAGSKSRDDCRPVADTGILKDIKEGIAALFKG